MGSPPSTSGEVTKIIPSPDARTRDIETLFRDDMRAPDDKVVTQLIPLRYADPEDIKRLLAPLVSKSSVILAYQPTNTLIITDVHSNIIRLVDILKTIDVEGVGQEISVVPLINADAEKMVKTLSTVFQAQKTAKRPGVREDSAKFVADERTNAVIILSSEDETDQDQTPHQPAGQGTPPRKRGDSCLLPGACHRRGSRENPSVPVGQIGKHRRRREKKGKPDRFRQCQDHLRQADQQPHHLCGQR